MSDLDATDRERALDLDGEMGLDDGAEADAVPTGRDASPPRRRTAATNRWMRWLHVYTSMISLIVVLFFGITGLTLNHPSWTLGDEAERSTFTGTLPVELEPDASDYFFSISEFMRDTYDVGGSVTDHGLNGNVGTISYKAPGYAADLFFQVDTGEYELVIQQQGFVAVMNDLHKGRDAQSSWKWVIDVSAILLVVVALTGLGIQLFQRKRRIRAVVVAGAGLVLTVVFVVVALG
ncbi:MAG: PepSY-associated TM helix domain-containing protein [Actinomycetota bacterium]|nr:PepSY-associated TM helix domain-containing protein [Actinomycetota bacterium]